MLLEFRLILFWMYRRMVFLRNKFKLTVNSRTNRLNATETGAASAWRVLSWLCFWTYIAVTKLNMKLLSCLLSLWIAGQVNVYGAAGDVDLTFDAGSGAIARTGLTDGAFSEISLLQDDRILLGGAFTNFSGITVNGLLRLNADGTQDPTFAANLNLGIVNPFLPPYVTGLQVLGDHRILFTCMNLSNINGLAASAEVNLSPAILFPDGLRDNSFQASTNINADLGSIWLLKGAAADFDGAFLYDSGGALLRRMNPDGNFQTNYPAGGSELHAAVRTIAIQDDGRTLLFANQTLYRLNADGTPDSTFPVWSPVAADFTGTSAGEVNQLLLLPDGKILVVGRFSWMNTIGQSFLRGSVARLNSDGSMDSTFNPGQGLDFVRTSPSLATNSGACLSVAIQASKLILAGTFTSFDGFQRTNLVRIEINGAFDPTLDAGPHLQSLAWVGVQSSGDILVAGGIGYPPFFLDYIAQLNYPVFTNGPAAGRPIVRLQGGRPVVSQQPTNIAVVVGQTAALSAVVSGSEPLSYQWFWNSNAVSGSTSSVLIFTNVQPHVAGAYHVVVTNFLGAVTSMVAMLTSTLPVDLEPPTITVQSPSSSFARVTGSILGVAGTASDNVGLSDVTVVHGTNEISFPITASSAQWSTTVSLDPGTNVITVRAVDLSGNFATSSRVVFYVTLSPLALAANGSGSVKGATNSQLLEVGRGYVLTARPDAGQVFSNWSGGVTSSAPVLNFLMRSNLVITADFVPNPFPAWAGAYQGLFYETNAVRHEAAGSFTLMLRSDGGFSARLQQGNSKPSFTGRFDLEGGFTNSVKRSGSDNLVVELALDRHGADQITGRILGDAWEAPLIADRATFNRRTAPATNYMSTYTVLVAGSTNTTFEPAGDSPGSFSVDANGVVKFKGVLADGSPMALQAVLSRDGVWPLYIPLYRGRGSLLGWIMITNSAEPDLGGLISWSRPMDEAAGQYTDGFIFDSMLLGSGYRAPGTNRLFASANAEVSFHDGDLGESFTNLVTLLPNAKVADAGTNRLKLTFTQKTGQFSGSVLAPGAKRPLSFKGAILQKQGYGGGFFPGTNRVGHVDFGLYWSLRN